MLNRTLLLRNIIRNNRSLATAVATEEFPFNVTLTPQKDKPAVVTSSKMENGFSVISKDCNSSVVSLKVAVMGGSAVESVAQKGAAQLLAAAAFAGSGEKSGLRIVRELENSGASFTAYADKEKIVYDVKTLADNVEPVIETVLSAIGSAPRADYILEECKEKVQLQHNDFLGNDIAQLEELVCEAAYGDSAPLGKSLYAANARNISVADALSYRATNFVRSNVVIAGSGLSHSVLTGLVEKYGASIPGGNPASPATSQYVGGDVKVRTDSNGVSNIALAFPVPSGDAAKPFVVLKALVDAHLKKQGVCARTFMTQYSSGGLFGIVAAGNATFAATVLEGAVAEIKAAAAKSPSAESEALKHKETLRNYVAMEGSGATGCLLEAHTLGIAPENYADLRSVSGDAVKAAAAQVLKSNPSYAVLGATAGTPSFGTVCSWLK